LKIPKFFKDFNIIECDIWSYGIENCKQGTLLFIKFYRYILIIEKLRIHFMFRNSLEEEIWKSNSSMRK